VLVDLCFQQAKLGFQLLGAQFLHLKLPDYTPGEVGSGRPNNQNESDVNNVLLEGRFAPKRRLYGVGEHSGRCEDQPCG